MSRKNTKGTILAIDMGNTNIVIGCVDDLSLIHISEPTRRTPISYAVFCLKKKKKQTAIRPVSRLKHI